MTCSLSAEMLTEIDTICYENRVNRSEFIREALTTYLKYFRAQAHNYTSQRRTAGSVSFPAVFCISINSTFVALILADYYKS
jgi:metal-responsive CopG/Arc/MetJ family transcriptional regulator